MELTNLTAPQQRKPITNPKKLVEVNRENQNGIFSNGTNCLYV